MVDFPLIEESDLDEIGDGADKYSTVNKTKIVKRASKRARRAIGGNGILTERLYREREEQTTWDLTFPSVEEFERLVLDDEEVEDGKYNVSNGQVEVTDDDLKEELKSRDLDHYVLRAEYVPGLIRELELDYAEKRLIRNSSITTNDESSQSQLEDIRRDIEDRVEQINRLAVSMADPKKGDHARNEDRRSVIL